MRTAESLQEEEEERMEVEVDVDVEDEDEEQIHKLRSKATELLLREEYKDSIQAYTQIISLCREIIFRKSPEAAIVAKLQKTLCLAFSNRAEARARLQESTLALIDCEEALRIENSHFKALLCKGKIFLSLNGYGMAMECFKSANLAANGNSDVVNSLLEKCKRFESLSRTGAFDVSDWVLNGFHGRVPELAEFVSSVEIKKSGISGRGMFATKNIESGALLVVTKAVAVERAIVMPQDSGKDAQLVIWKNFIEKVTESATKCSMVRDWLAKLSSGEDDEEGKEVPDIRSFNPEAIIDVFDKNLDKGRLVSILDVNSILENAVSSKVLGKNADYEGVGLWILPSFINHSCDPNVRRVHIGDHVVVHASRNVKAGEELTFAYFDVLCPLNRRREMATNWGFVCECRRCKFEEDLLCKQEMREIEAAMGDLVYRLEEGMRKWMIRGKKKGYLRASFWEAYSELYGCEKMVRKWGRKVPSVESVVDSVVDAVGSDERIVCIFMEGLKRGGVVNGVVEMEKAMKFWRGVYGKVMKKQAMRTLIDSI
ncbi:methyltransferase FGSG_00040 [Andrographis paniculata]|uniref:methyltransferase FGSG_00040 n=1 Tax=Andrographis paniculata TaxID=175694 RepID=UPI0021E935DC|nr:methyltransferase FGSG_00040 [Andrographis paniculata]